MADLGQDKYSLQIKAKELEVTIRDKELAKDKIDLDKLRWEQKLRTHKESIGAIDDQIEQHKIDLKSISEVLTKLEE